MSGTALTQRHRDTECRKFVDSGVAWIGQVPEGWKILPLYSAVAQVKNVNADNHERNLLSLSYGHIKRKNIETMTGLVPASYAGYNIIDAGDIVLRLTDLQNDQKSIRVGLSRERGIVTSAYVTIRPNNQISPDFLACSMLAFDAAKGFYGIGSGVRQGLTYDEVKRLKFQFPPLPIQRAIASFLDRECGKIDALRGKIGTQIEKLDELKKSIITEAVTGKMGVGGKRRKMRPSGVEWIGDVPEGWKVSKLSYRYSVQLGKMLDASKITGEWLVPYLRNQDVQWNKVIVEGLPTMDIRPEEREKFSAHKGDLLICEGGEVGRCAILREKGPIYFQKAIMRARPLTTDDSTLWLYYLLHFAASVGAFDSATGKATIAHLPAEKLLAQRFPFPPLAEQREIVEYLDRKCGAIDAAKGKCRAELEKLSEYKKSLIYECVTGKREVA